MFRRGGGGGGRGGGYDGLASLPGGEAIPPGSSCRIAVPT